MSHLVSIMRASLEGDDRVLREAVCVEGERVGNALLCMRACPPCGIGLGGGGIRGIGVVEVLGVWKVLGLLGLLGL